MGIIHRPDRERVVPYWQFRLWLFRMRGTAEVGIFSERRGEMSGNNFIMMVVMILILLFVIMSIGPLFSIGGFGG